MSDKTNRTISGVTEVGCTVQHCKYQDKGRCCAAHINVQNRSAETKGETFCDTFQAETTF